MCITGAKIRICYYLDFGLVVGVLGTRRFGVLGHEHMLHRLWRFSGQLPYL